MMIVSRIEQGRNGGLRQTSPRSRRILKLLLLILSCGEPGKHEKQLPNVYTKSRKYDGNEAREDISA